MLNPFKVYRHLLRLYPATFRERYERAIEQQFRDEYREAASRRDRMFVWLVALRDLVTSVPRELAGEFAQDLKYGFRVHRRHPVPAVLAVAALAFSIGAATGLFSVLNAVLLRSLPFLNPEQLVELRNSPFSAGLGHDGFDRWRKDSAYLQDAATFSTSDMNLAGRNDAMRVRVAETSANFHRMLGMTPIFGRTFAREEDRHANTGVAVISYSLWQQVFGGSPGISGTPLQLNGVPFTIIGVAPSGFDYPATASVWIPTAFDFERVPKRGAFLLQTIGRVKNGAGIEGAAKLFEADVQRNSPELLLADDLNRPRAVSILDELSGPVGKAAWLLTAMILFVLLTAAANVAHLLLFRISERRDEMIVRIALGGSRARLIQQLTTEAIVLTGAGACAGLPIAVYASQLMSKIAPPMVATQHYIVFDWRVLGFAVALAVATAILFGVLPIFVAGHLQSAAHVVRTQPGSLTGSASKRVRFALLALQASLTLVLLSTSMTMGRTFLHLLGADLGFRPEGAVTMTASLQGTKYRSSAAQWSYYSEALERLRAVPGVESAGAVSYLPLANNVYMANAFTLDSGQVIGRVVTNASTAEYFRSIGTKFLAGRDFEASRSRLEPVVIVNEAFARTAGLGAHAVGRRVFAPWTKTPYVIAGVVETSRAAGPAHAGTPMIYWPVDEEPPSNLTFVARVNGSVETYLARCRDAVKAIDLAVPIYQVASLEQRRADVLSRPRFFATSTFFLALLALFLAVIGTFGTAAQAVAQRSREMGIRMALGGSHARLRASMLRQSVVPTLTGCAIGVGIAVAIETYIGHSLEGIRSGGPLTYAAAACGLSAVAPLAAWRASAKLLAVNPADAVRAQ